MAGKRGPKISLNVKREIRKRALEYPRGPRTALAIELQDLIERWGEPVPSQETLEKMISEIRNSDDEQDKVWSLVSLPLYPIPPEAIPYVLKVWARAIEKDNPITIREALWVARLYSVFIDNALGSLGKAYKTGEVQAPQYQSKLNNILTSMLSDTVNIDALLDFAQIFAVNEKILNQEDSYPDTRKGILSYWLNDAEAYGVLPEGQPSAGDLSTRISQEFGRMYEKSEEGKEAHHERSHSQEGQE